MIMDVLGNLTPVVEVAKSPEAERQRGGRFELSDEEQVEHMPEEPIEEHAGEPIVHEESMERSAGKRAKKCKLKNKLGHKCRLQLMRMIRRGSNSHRNRG